MLHVFFNITIRAIICVAFNMHSYELSSYVTANLFLISLCLNRCLSLSCTHALRTYSSENTSQSPTLTCATSGSGNVSYEASSSQQQRQWGNNDSCAVMMGQIHALPWPNGSNSGCDKAEVMWGQAETWDGVLLRLLPSAKKDVLSLWYVLMWCNERLLWAWGEQSWCCTCPMVFQDCIHSFVLEGQGGDKIINHCMSRQLDIQ